MVPIGVVTRNRAACLDATLRSLSATILPDDAALTVFDDASTDPLTRRYLETDEPLTLPPIARDDHWWRQQGLGGLSRQPRAGRGLRGLVRVEQLAAGSLGVVAASVEAIRRLFHRAPGAPAVLLLQDDVLFNSDWYGRMLGASGFPKPLGVLAGIKLNMELPSDVPWVASGITAQCLLVTRAAWETVPLLAARQPEARRRFDDMLRRQAEEAGLWAGVIMPFVCQHFGVRSLVRPGVTWTLRGAQGRVGLYANPPYALAAAVRAFP